MQPIKFDPSFFPQLETFPAPSSHQAIQFVIPEMTSVCPKTGLPDFCRVIIKYVPNELCVELKSLKLWFFSFYGVGIFHEAATKFIYDTFVAAITPRALEIITDW